MSEEKKDTIIKDTSVEKGFKYGTTPYLTLTLLKGKNAFHFQMPIGTHLDDCVEAAEENLKMVKSFRDSAKKQEAEAKLEKEKKEKEDSGVEVTPDKK